MTTEDIRVIRPSCEKIFTGNYTGVSLLVDIVNLFIKRRDFTLTLDNQFGLTLSVELFKDERYCNMLGIPYKKVQAMHVEGKTKYLIEMAKNIYQLVTDVYRLTPLVHTIRRYMYLPEKERKVFIFEGSFYDKFSKIRLDSLTTDHLPKEGGGCIVLPKPLISGVMRIDEVIFTTDVHDGHLMDSLEKTFERTKTDPNYLKSGDIEAFLKMRELARKGTQLQLLIVGIDRVRKAVSVCNVLDLVPNKKLKEFPTTDIDSNDPDYSENDKHAARPVIDQVLNLLAYINSGNPDIREFQNTIRYRGKSTVHVRPEDEELSRGKIFLVGFNWLKNPVYAVDGWWSSGYMAWKMCGPGRTEPRLVTFKGSFKQRRKGREDVVTEEDAVEGEDFAEC